MAFDDKLAERVRVIIAHHPAITEKKMFGGLAFMVNGNMFITVSSTGGILARIGPDCYENVCDESGVELAVMRGRPMNGWVRVNVEKLRTRKQLERWLAYCLTYTDQIPPKK